MIRSLLGAVGMIILFAGSVWFLRGLGVVGGPGDEDRRLLAAGVLIPAGLALFHWATRGDRRRRDSMGEPPGTSG